MACLAMEEIMFSSSPITSQLPTRYFHREPNTIPNGPWECDDEDGEYAIELVKYMKANNIEFKMLPYFFADVFDLSQQLTSENTGQNVQSILQNFSNLATENPELYKIYQSGKPTALTEYYKAVYKDNPKLYEQKLSRFKLWSKYFN